MHVLDLNGDEIESLIPELNISEWLKMHNNLVNCSEWHSIYLFLLYLNPNNKNKNIINLYAESLKDDFIFAQYIIGHKLFVEVCFLLFFVAV